MNKIQNIVKGRPTAFSRRTRCPLGTAKRYSRGVNQPAEWIISLIFWALRKGYACEMAGRDKLNDKEKGDNND